MSNNRLGQNLARIAADQLKLTFPFLPAEYLLQGLHGEFAIIKFPSIRIKVLVKLCRDYPTRKKIELTTPESNILKECAGVIFIMPKGDPPREIRGYDYDFLYIKARIMSDEIEHHLKSVESVCCFRFVLNFHPSRILNQGCLLETLPLNAE